MQREQLSGQFGIEIIGGSDLHETEPNGISSTTGEEIPPTILILEDNNSSDEQPQVAPAVAPRSAEAEFESAYREFEAYPTYPLPDHLPPVFNQYFTEIVNGQISNAIDEEAITHMAEGYFPMQPIIPISEEQRAYIQSDIERQLTDTQLHVARDILVHPDAKLVKSTPSSMVPIGVDLEDTSVSVGKSLTPEDRLRILTNPDLYLNTPVTLNNFGGKGVKHWGTRPLSLYNLAKGASEVVNFVASVEGENKRMLDIGGSTGLAAHDIETAQGTISVTNLTTTPEPGVYPLRGGHRLGVAQQLPMEDFEKYQGILSHYAFPYIRYPHIALCNSVLALQPGGMMSIDYREGTFTDKKAEFLAQSQNSGRVFERLDQLAQKGAITYLPNHHVRFLTATGIPVPLASINIQKNTSIDPEDVIKFDQFEF